MNRLGRQSRRGATSIMGRRRLNSNVETDSALEGDEDHFLWDSNRDGKVIERATH